MNTKLTLSAVFATALLAGCSTGGSGITGTVDHKNSEYECHSMASTPTIALVSFEEKSGGSSGDRGRNKSGFGSGKTTKKSDTQPGKSTTKKPRKHKSGTDGATCNTDWELFIKNKDGVHEEDVSQETYDACAIKDSYPKCAK